MSCRILAPTFFLLSLILFVGCGSRQPKSTDHAEVTGKVYFKGKPLAGGRVSFVAVKGGFAASGNIEEDGDYKVSAPVGEVQISVDNTMFAPRKGGVAEKPILKKPGAEESHQLKGKYVPLPRKFEKADESGLKYTVTKGSQTYDIKLE
jgi:hypothetical protein